MGSLPSWVGTVIVLVVAIFLFVWAAHQLGIHF